MKRLLHRLTTERAATIIVFTLLFALACRVGADPDMWWHLALGQSIRDTGELVSVDSYSHTYAGSVYKNHSAIGQIVLSMFWSAAGHFGMTMFVAVLAVGGMYFLFRAGSGTIYMQGFVLIFGAACAAAFWSPRPQMFTFFFGALLVSLLFDRARTGRDRLWLLPGLMWLWANLHGGYIVGYLFVAVFVFGEWMNGIRDAGRLMTPSRDTLRLLGLALVSLALLPIHPLGIGVFATPFETLTIGGLRSFIQEWKPPDFSQSFTWGFLILLVLLFGAVSLSRRRIDFREWLLVGITLTMALFSGRHLSLFAIAAVPITTTHLDQVLTRRGWTIPRRSLETPTRVAVNLLLIVLVTIGTIGRLRYLTDADTVDEMVALNWPVGAVDYLNSSNLEGNLFNSYNWGGYLILRAPHYPVFIDGRTDLYPDFLGKYNSAVNGTPLWREVFDRWGIGIVLIETGSVLAGQLAADPGWRSEYKDGVASIYIRRDSQIIEANP